MSDRDKAIRLILFSCLVVFCASAQAQQRSQPDLENKQQEFEKLEDAAMQSRGRKHALESKVAELTHSRERLNQELLEATNKLRQMENRASEIETRLETLIEREKTITQSLDGRRAVIAEILIVLQRMGRRPPPALLTRPQDILESLRAALALESILPPMRAEARALQNDLTELLRLRESMQNENEKLIDEKTLLKSQSIQLIKIIASRQENLLSAQTQLKSEAERAQALAQRATSLKDLISRMENESDAGRRAAIAARQSDAAQARLNEDQRRMAHEAPFQDLSRLAPVIPFSELKARLSLPAAGMIAKRYGSPDGNGGKEKGVSIATRANGIVTAPCDGWIAFSGPYRSYGQLLIINAGDGYYVVLAGMSRSNVNVGQFVLAGEPVASMGDGTAQTAATIAIGASTPILYVEFRKDGASIDPGPWWARSDSRKVGG